MIRVVSRAQFPVAVQGEFSGGEATIYRMVRDCPAGRTGAALIAWSDALFCARLPVSEPQNAAFDWEVSDDGDDELDDILVRRWPDACRHCNRLLDAFGQCMHCDTYGTPAEQRAERQHQGGVA